MTVLCSFFIAPLFFSSHLPHLSSHLSHHHTYHTVSYLYFKPSFVHILSRQIQNNGKINICCPLWSLKLFNAKLKVQSSILILYTFLETWQISTHGPVPVPSVCAENNVWCLYTDKKIINWVTNCSLLTVNIPRWPV